MTRRTFIVESMAALLGAWGLAIRNRFSKKAPLELALNPAPPAKMEWYIM